MWTVRAFIIHNKLLSIFLSHLLVDNYFWIITKAPWSWGLIHASCINSEEVVGSKPRLGCFHLSLLPADDSMLLLVPECRKSRGRSREKSPKSVRAGTSEKAGAATERKAGAARKSFERGMKRSEEGGWFGTNLIKWSTPSTAAIGECGEKKKR